MSTSESQLLTTDLITFDPGVVVPDVRSYAEAVVSRVEASWDSGADLVLLPEFTWMGLEPLIHGGEKSLRAVSEVFWGLLLPQISLRLCRPGKAVVLGTAPCLIEGGEIRNRAVIFSDSRQLHQDKLHLTPWESAFSAGESVHLWSFRGFCIAVVICLDIEIPELSARLRDAGVDLILCPSATETELGVERVNRCASARSVELGCYVAVSHLTGSAVSDLIDDNIGRAALYRPSQAAFHQMPRSEETELFSRGSHDLRVHLDRRALEVMRRMKAETNPSNLGKNKAGLQREIPLKYESQS